MRLVRPAVLIDLNALRDLERIAPAADGGLTIGALTRQSDLIASPLVRERAPLLAEATRHVGHPAIRNRGTIGGSVAHADPAAELPAALVALDATFVVTGPRGERTVRADEFFQGLLATALADDELLTTITVPAAPPAWGFAEIARRSGDFALAGAVAVVGLDAARIVGFGVGDRPLRCVTAERTLRTVARDGAAAARAGVAAAAEADPPDDVHASGPYRRHLLGVMTERALLQAFTRPVRSP